MGAKKAARKEPQQGAKRTGERRVALQEWPLENLVPYARNARTHSDEQVAKIAASIREFGFTNPILVDGGAGIIAGHGRLAAARSLGMQTVPVIELTHLTEDQKRAYIIADNRLALDAGWDEDVLRGELAELDAADFDLSLTGFSDEELDRLLAAPIDEGLTGEDEVPEVRPDPVSVTGDVWQLGPHRVMCGDSTSVDDVKKLMAGATARLLHADPPYGMGKEADGVANDNLYAEKLDQFQMEWWATWRTFLTANASAYIWGNAPDLWRLWYAGGLGKSEPLTLRNEIVWDKKSIAGMASPDLTQFPEATERCLFFQLGRHVFLINQTKDDYWPGWEPIRTWLCEQRDAAGFTAADVRKICGNHMYGHWFGQSQWVFISPDNYAKLAAAAHGKAFTRPYDDLQREYREIQRRFNGEVRDDRREAFDAARPYFDNAHDTMRDVWEFPRVTGEDRHGHATPKPVAMMERVMRASLRDGELCVEPFGGSGATLIGAVKAGRVCYTMEMQAQYVDVIVRRWEAFTGKAATLEGDGRPFAEVAAARVRS